MAYTVPALNEPLGRTSRSDTWWLVPSLMAATFIGFVVYAAWASFQPVQYAAWEAYRSPFYSPDLSKYFPGFPWSPALLVVWIPAGFRLTCYYGRKAYFRSLLLSPPACAVGKGSGSYRGETALPWIINNLHRYMLYLVLILVAFHWIHLMEAFHFSDGFHMGIGTIVAAADTIFLSLYALGCHSLRHIVGGNVDCWSCAAGGKARHSTWKFVTWLNEYHNIFFWLSLFTVGFADVYIRLVAMGIWTDVRIF